MKSFSKRFLCLFLSLVTVLSCISFIEPDIAEATSAGASYNGAGNTSYNSGGTYMGTRSGIRIYIIDRNGNRVSNIADIANRPSMSGDLDVVVCDTGRTEELSYHFKNLPSGQEIYEMGVEGPLKHWIANPSNIDPQSESVSYDPSGGKNCTALYTNVANYTNLVPVVSGNILKGEKERAKGKQIGDYFTGAKKLQPQWDVLNGGGTGDGTTEATTPPPSNGIIAESLAEQLYQIEDRLMKNYDVYREQYLKGAFSKTKVADMVLEEANSITKQIVDADVYNQEDIDVIGGKVKEILATIEKKLQDLPYIEPNNKEEDSQNNNTNKNNEDDKEFDESLDKSGKSLNYNSNSLFDVAYASSNKNDNNTIDFWSLVNELYDTAYGDDSSGKELKPIYKDEKLSLLFEATWYGVSLLSVKFDKKVIDNKTGKLQVISSLAANDYIVMMEPIMWNRLQDSKCYRSKFVFYGTPYNLGQFMAQQASMGRVTIIHELCRVPLLRHLPGDHRR